MHIWHTFNLHFPLYVDVANARQSLKVVLSITRKALYIIIKIPCYITPWTLMFGRSKVKVFFGPLFPPVLIIFAQLIIDVKVED